MAFGRYYIRFNRYNDYSIIDRYHNCVIANGTLEEMNAKADELKDVDDEIHE